MSWLDISEDVNFWWGEIPFGVISMNGGPLFCATTVGDQVVNLSKLDEVGCFDNIEGLEDDNLFLFQSSLDVYLKQPSCVREQVHHKILQELLQSSTLNNTSGLHKSVFYAKDDATIHVAFQSYEDEVIPEPFPSVTTKPSDRYQNFKLYGSWESSCTWRVRVALLAKNIPYETFPINILKGEQYDKNYIAKINPLGEVPVLEFTDTHTDTTHKLTQSVAILEFLEQVFPHRRYLFPKDPLERAKAYQMVEVINSGTQPIQNMGFLQQNEEKASWRSVQATDIAQQAVAKGLCALEMLVLQWKELSSSSSNKDQRLGPYCLGTFSPTVVEVFLIPQIAEAKRLGVSVEEMCPVLAKIDKLCSKHRWFQQQSPYKKQQDTSSQKAAILNPASSNRCNHHDDGTSFSSLSDDGNSPGHYDGMMTSATAQTFFHLDTTLLNKLTHVGES